MPHKHILLISHDLNCTGAPSSLLRHAKYYLDAGHDVDVWAADDGSLKARYEESGLSPKIVKNAYEDIRQLVAENKGKYDLVVCNTIVTYKFADVWQREKTPVIWFIRETCLLDQWYPYKLDFAFVFKHFYNLYCPSEYAASVIRFYNNNVRIVPNSTEDLFGGYTPIAEAVRFGYIGSIIHNKGIDLLVRAFHNAKSLNPNITLTIAGNPNTRLGRTLEENTKSESGITWLGELQGNDKARFFDTIDILCVPSLDEPFGLTVLEGAMYGKVVILTDRVGAKFIADGEPMAVVKAGDSRSLENALCYYSRMEKQALRASQAKARQNYLVEGCPTKERELVLTMLADNIGNIPPECKHCRNLFSNVTLSKAQRFLRRNLLNFALWMNGRGVWSRTGKVYF